MSRTYLLHLRAVEPPASTVPVCGEPAACPCSEWTLGSGTESGAQWRSREPPSSFTSSPCLRGKSARNSGLFQRRRVHTSGTGDTRSQWSPAIWGSGGAGTSGGRPALQSCPRAPTTYKGFTGLSPTLPRRGPRASTFPETRAEGRLCWSGSPGLWDLCRVGGQTPSPCQLTWLMPAATKHREPGQRRDCQLRWGGGGGVTGTPS